jgi:DMSO reductase anchor subunit
LSRTEPHLVIKPHPALSLVSQSSKISNREETSPFQPKVTAKDEIPLILFTLLAQMAVGLYGAIFLINLSFADKQIARNLTFVPFIAVGATILITLIASLFHLKTPEKSWRVLTHLRKSWLSREILFFLTFAGLWLIQGGLGLFLRETFIADPFIGLLIFICGLISLYCMQRVYQLRSMPGWNTNRTLFEFSLSPIVIGCYFSGAVLPGITPNIILAGLALTGVIAFSIEFLILLSHPEHFFKRLYKWRWGLLLAGFVLGIFLFLLPRGTSTLGWVLLLIVAFAEETIGRWLFYMRRTPGI